MAQLTVDIGGRAGIDCRGFCEYCYFKKVKTTRAFGCRYCLPFKKGCDYCTKGVREEYTGFKDLRTIADETLAALQTKSGDLDRITISGGGDPSCYPQFTDLIELLGATEAPLHIGYTSGKGWDDPAVADLLIENGLAECSFTVFAADPALRKRWMHDPTPDASLAILERLCGSVDLYAAAVVLPGVNNGAVLEHTCEWLEERGAKGLILMRFANATEQGLILENAPVIRGQAVQTVDAFRDMVTDLSSKFKMKISGTPLWDPEIGSPFAILHEPTLLKKLPRVRRRASVITGSVAAPFISEVLSARGATSPVIPVTKRDRLPDHHRRSRKSRPLDSRTDGHHPGPLLCPRCGGRETAEPGRDTPRGDPGPDQLTADAETSMGMTRNQVLALEMEGFSNLIRQINLHGE